MLPILTYYQESDDYEGIGTHFHGYHELILIREGTVDFRINQKKILAQPNSLVIIRAMDRHDAFLKKQPYKRYVFTVTNQLMLTAVHEPKLLSLFDLKVIVAKTEVSQQLRLIKIIPRCIESGKDTQGRYW